MKKVFSSESAVWGIITLATIIMLWLLAPILISVLCVVVIGGILVYIVSAFGYLIRSIFGQHENESCQNKEAIDTETTETTTSKKTDYRELVKSSITKLSRIWTTFKTEWDKGTIRDKTVENEEVKSTDKTDNI